MGVASLRIRFLRGMALGVPGYFSHFAFSFISLSSIEYVYRVYTGSLSLYTGSHRPQNKLVLTARLDLDCLGKTPPMSHSILWQYAGRHLNTISRLGSLAGICDS
jgi:hypothetical protein